MVRKVQTLVSVHPMHPGKELRNGFFALCDWKHRGCLKSQGSQGLPYLHIWDGCTCAPGQLQCSGAREPWLTLQFCLPSLPSKL